LLSIELSRSYILGHEFSKLVVLTRVIFCLYLIIFFLNSIFQHRVDWELGFIIVSRFVFYRVIIISLPELWVLWVSKVDSCFFVLFLIDFFFLSFILQYLVDWELYFIIFLIVFYKVILVSWPSFDRLIWVDLSFF